jgi:Ras-related GTP-binding protein A/B
VALILIRQDNLMGLYFNQYPDRIFSDVRVLIYVFDVNEMEETDMELYRKTVEHLYRYSPDSKIFVLIHKMDT